MGPYARGFRDGAAEATQAMSQRLRDAIDIVEEPRDPPLFSQEKVADMFRLIARNIDTLAAQIQAVGESDEENAHEDSQED